jgi:hypothetical protein
MNPLTEIGMPRLATNQAKYQDNIGLMMTNECHSFDQRSLLRKVNSAIKPKAKSKDGC